ncbi:hypothetical protein SELMODRAFT_447028 [Selaginella moellendorffii]|uniref:F-box/LRR-repeat protein 15/At3g58940/PEG3-like LRR domain-containing protein n=1 Tax=Selaginella moellendorffii TaxID=88036 RepID=D8SW46_SELML|nr:hypothetical protein SELMODRAFT_447028 [Selaginella moellendorffii]
MRRSMELDDCSLVEILSKVEDARTLAPCKRWEELRWAVSRLSFDFPASTNEGRRGCNLQTPASSDAPRTRLPAASRSSPSVSTVAAIVVSNTIGKLASLNVCEFHSPVSNPLLQMLLSSCPKLQILSAVHRLGDNTLTVSSGSLRVLSVYEPRCHLGIMVDAPKLQFFRVGFRPYDRITRSSRAKLVTWPVGANWTKGYISAIAKLSQFSPKVSKLSLLCFDSDHVLSYFRNMETLCVDSYSFQSFVPGGVSNCKRKNLTIHFLILGNTLPNVAFLSQMRSCIHGYHQVRPSHSCWRGQHVSVNLRISAHVSQEHRLLVVGLYRNRGSVEAAECWFER